VNRRILYREECFQIQGAVFEVYREMHCGYTEAVYRECLEKEFAIRGIPFVARPQQPLIYKGDVLQQSCTPDFICHGVIVVALKAVAVTTDEHKLQVLNCLRATGKRLGLLANFGCYPKATVERIVL
jgi:GxxExxY protein